MRFFLGGCLAMGLMASAASAVVLQPTVGGLTSVSVQQGGSLSVDITLGGALDALNVGNGLFTVEFSKPGLTYTGYAWATPFGTGGSNDASNPKTGFPISIIGTTYVNAARPAAVDVYLENGLNDPLFFNGGQLVSLNLTIPTDFETGPVTITAVPDQFGILSDPFVLNGVTSGSLAVEVTPVPEPTFLGLAGVTLMLLGRRATRRAC